MDIAYRLILYILMANVGYMIFSLFGKGYRCYSGYIAQLFFLLCLMIVMIARGVDGLISVLISVAGIGILVIVPMFLQRQIDVLISENRLNEIEFFARWKAHFAWSEINHHLHWLAKLAMENADEELKLKQTLRESLDKGEPYDGMTRAFLGVIHFNTRDFDALITDIRLKDRELNEQSFEELLYLVRAYLETTQYNEAIEAQIALESTAAMSGNSMEKRANLVVSRMLLFSFLGWKKELESLLDSEEPGIISLPPSLKDFWLGVGIFHAGDFEQGTAQMAKVISESSADEENESWLPFMRKRYYSLLENRTFIESRLLEKLQEIHEKNHMRLDDSLARFQAETVQEPVSDKATATVLWVTAAVSVFLMFYANIEDIANLIRFGANSSFLVKNGEYFRLFTYQFIHIGWIHLFMNLLALKIFGPPVETTLGWPLFIGLYFFSGIAGGAAAVYAGQPLSAGASAAVLGLLSASIVFELFTSGPKRNTNFSTLIFILVMNLIIGAVEKGVDNSAHIGGLIAGAVISVLLIPSLSRPHLKRILGFLFFWGAIAIGLISSWQLINSKPESGLPYKVGEFRLIQSNSGRQSVELPDSWKVEKIEEKNRILEAVGPFKERMTIIWAPNDSAEEDVLNEYISLRTTEIEKSEDIALKSRRGPEKISLRGQTYKIRWALETGGGPVSVVDYMVFDKADFFLVRFFLGTSFDNLYDSIMDRAVITAR